MKKLMLLFVILLGTQMTYAQLPWDKLREMYDDTYKTAEGVGDQTDRVVALETKSDDELLKLRNSISLMKTAGSVTFKRELDPDMPVEFYKYTLAKPDGREIPLVEKMLVEKVIEKYDVVLNKLKTSLKADRKIEAAEVLSILDDL